MSKSAYDIHWVDLAVCFCQLVQGPEMCAERKVLHFEDYYWGILTAW